MGEAHACGASRGRSLGQARSSDQLCPALILCDPTDPDDVTCAHRKTRYISPTVMLRSDMTAKLPTALQNYAGRSEVDELIVAPDVVYGRDVVNRSYVGGHHRGDLWRIRRTPDTGDEDMLTTIKRMAEAVLSRPEWNTTVVSHPSTLGAGRSTSSTRANGSNLPSADAPS